MAKRTEEEEALRRSYGGSAYDQQHFTDEELRLADSIRQAARRGETDWDSAHSYVESIRKKYGYSGGEDGSKYQATGGFQYQQEAPVYTNRYQEQMDRITQDILNREEFSYDHTADPQYQAYQKQYIREGQRATQDALGNYAALTGGMPSTAALAAATQAGDYYAAQLADKVPQLYQQAYSRYQDALDSQRADLEMLAALESGDYQRYLDSLAQYNTDRQFQYDSYLDGQQAAWEQEKFNQSLAWDKEQFNQNLAWEKDKYAQDSAWEQEQFNQSLAWDKEQFNQNLAWEKDKYAQDSAWDREKYEDEREQTAWERALEKAETLAAAGDFSGYAALGYSQAEIARLAAAYQQALAAAKSRGSGSSSKGSGSSSKDSGSGGSASSVGTGVSVSLNSSAQAYRDQVTGTRDPLPMGGLAQIKQELAQTGSGLVGLYPDPVKRTKKTGKRK